MQEIIKAKQIFKKHGQKEIIKGIDFSIKEGEFISIMGPSGAGKTTFMNILSGLEKADGEIIIKDKNLSKLKEPKLTKFRRANMSYIFQDYNLIDFLSVKHNIITPNKFSHNKLDMQLYKEVLIATNLVEHENKLPSQLSGGQKQRVAIARSIVNNCDIIFADEPTGALDLKTRDQIMKLLVDLVHKYHRTLVLVTHDPSVASYADKVVFLVDGQIQQVIEKSNSLKIALIIDELEKAHV